VFISRTKKVVVSLLALGSIILPIKSSANLKLQSKANQLCYDLFCGKSINVPFELSTGNSAITRSGIAKWSTLFDSARITQLACTDMGVNQSELVNGALALSITIKPVIGCNFKPKALISARKFSNAQSKARFQIIGNSGPNRWAQITGTEISVGQSTAGNPLLGVRVGAAMIDDGRTVGSGFQAEAYPSGWVVTRSREILVENTSRKILLEKSILRTDPSASVYVEGERVEVSKDGLFEAARGQDISVMDVSGNVTQWHYAMHGLRVHPLR
jgi:hypothetical protein